MRGHQQGYGMPVFSGAAYQRGYGLGRVMKNVMRQATPLLKHAGKQALKKGLSVIVDEVTKRPRHHKKISPNRVQPTKNIMKPKKPASKLPSKKTQRPVGRDIFSL
jgi:hypothetical protein